MTTRSFTAASVLLAIAVAAGCGRRADSDKPDPPSLNVTNWSGASELYMEYPPLAAGQTARFAVHLTKLANFKPLTAGRPSIELTPEDGGDTTVLKGSAPSRPGAFAVEGRLPAAGRYRWALTIAAPDLTDRHDLGAVTIYPDERRASEAANSRPPEDAAAIAYLKEQQWTNEFATALVREAEVRTSVRAPATLAAVHGGEAVVAAPAAGRLVAERLPSTGNQVPAGAVLARLEPRMVASADRATLVADVAEAQAALEGARIEHTRVERLLADRAVPARRVEEAQRAVTVAEARLEAARARLTLRDETLRTGGGAAAGNAFVLRAPISGRITQIMATLGASYDEGAPLFKLARTDVLELHAFVPAAESAAVRGLGAAALEIPGRDEPIELRFRNVHDAGVLDPMTKALAIHMEIDNPGGQLLIGQEGTAVLYTAGRQRLPAVPTAAVLREAGRPYVFVQTGGERFARRFVDIAARDGDLIGIRSGVKPGERVVVRGSYEVQLASAAKGLPAEGHVH